MFVEPELNEDDWLSANTLYDAEWMMRRIWLDTMSPSRRKSQLWACACAREIWHLIDDERSRKGVEIAEANWVSQIPGQVAQRAAQSAFEACAESPKGEIVQAPDGVLQSYYPETYWARQIAAIASGNWEKRYSDWKLVVGMRKLNFPVPHLPAQLARDVFGNPLQPRSIDHQSLFGQQEVFELARSMYARRDFSRMCELGSRLEEARITDSVILKHCESLTPHIRGCWVVDLLLGKE